MNNKKNIHVENPQKDIEQQMRKYIIEKFFQPNKKCNISFNRLPYMKFLIINNKFSDFVDELIKDIAVWIYEKNHCETKYINCAKIIIDDMKNAFSKIVRNVYYGENYNYKNEENFIDPEFLMEDEDEDESEKIMLDILSIFSILTKEANNYGIKCKVPKTERAAATKVDGGKGELISGLRLFVDNMLTDKCSQFSNNEGYNNMINSIGGYEFERIFQPINFILDSMISIKMDEDKNLKNRIKNIRHYDNVKDKYKYIVNVTNYSTYPVFLGTYLKRMYLETEINVDKWVFNYIKNYRECFCDIYNSYEDEEDEQTTESSNEDGHVLEFSCKYNGKYMGRMLKYFFKDEETEEEQTQEFSYGDEETEEEQAQESAVLADEIKDIFHQNSYGMMNIENNYMEAMLSETFRYKDIDKNMRLSVRVKDAFIKYNRDKWLEKFNDVNTEWINECICLGEFFENIMKEMSAYLEQICEKEDIIAWSRNVVEECKKEDDINKLSEHLYGIWNSVYNYAIENKIAITKVRNEYFEKYFYNEKLGQFFTPPSLCKLIAELNPIEGKNVYDPCCGSGRLFLSAAEKNRDITFYGGDVSETGCKMTLINMCLNGLKCRISWMNSLSMEVYKEWAVTFTIYPRIPFIVELKEEIQTEEMKEVEDIKQVEPVPISEQKDTKQFKFRRFIA